MKRYTSSPLPFRGSKRFFVRRFREVLEQAQDVDTIIDLFGGSGLLARVAKDTLPNCTVIYNDYDWYVDRLAVIPQTNALLRQIASLLKEVPDNKKLPAEVKERVLSLILEREACGEKVDYLTVSSSLLFSGNWAQSFCDMEKQTMYNRIVATAYNADNYTDGLQITHEDYKSLFARHKDNTRVLFVLDPPYLQTDVTAYKSDVYWHLKDYLDVLNLMRGTRFIMFTSGKSQIIELCDWMNENLNVPLLAGAKRFERNSTMNNVATYKDIMITKL